MNDETHDSGPDEQPADSVLRPFEAPDQPPLPPIEPSRVVPDPPMAAEEPVPPPPPVEALADDPWSPAVEAQPDAIVADSEIDTAEALDDDTLVEAEIAESAEAPESVDAAVDAEAVMVVPPPPEDHPAETDADTESGLDSETTTVPVAAAETITLPRKPFLIGLGVLLAAVALLAALWQSAGGDEPETVTEAPSREVEPIDEPDDTPTETAPPVVDEPPVDDGTAAALDEATAEIASLESEVAALNDRPPPAIEGTKMRRIVIGADAKFVSALPESVAVVGAFGGVSLIDPITNRVVANGNIADAATRVLRTASAVWITNYSDNQLLRVDPVTNTIAASFPFEGPDGIDKDGNTLIVASFDGGFVARVNPSDGSITQQVDVGGKPTEVFSHPDHGLWAAVFDTGELVQIDRDSFEILQRIVVGQGPVGITAAPKHLWVANHDEGTIAKVDPETGEVVLTVAVGIGPTEVAVGNGYAWATATDDGNLVQVDTNDGSVLSITPLGGAAAGGGPTGIAFADGTLWVAIQGEQSVVRIDLG